jgi:hypothetical protein
MLRGTGGKPVNENERESVEPTLPQMVERYREQKRKGHEMVAAMFRAAVERDRDQKQRQRAAVEQVHRESIEQGRGELPPPYEPATIAYTELPPPQKADGPNALEWNFYRREVGRLLAQGHEGRFILIKGEEVIGIWDTQEEAKAVALQKYLMQPCLIHQIRSREPVVRMSLRFWQWQG